MTPDSVDGCAPASFLKAPVRLSRHEYPTALFPSGLCFCRRACAADRESDRTLCSQCSHPAQVAPFAAVLIPASAPSLVAHRVLCLAERAAETRRTSTSTKPAPIVLDYGIVIRNLTYSVQRAAPSSTLSSSMRARCRMIWALFNTVETSSLRSFAFPKSFHGHSIPNRFANARAML